MTPQWVNHTLLILRLFRWNRHMGVTPTVFSVLTVALNTSYAMGYRPHYYIMAGYVTTIVNLHTPFLIVETTMVNQPLLNSYVISYHGKGCPWSTPKPVNHVQFYSFVDVSWAHREFRHNLEYAHGFRHSLTTHTKQVICIIMSALALNSMIIHTS